MKFASVARIGIAGLLIALLLHSPDINFLFFLLLLPFFYIGRPWYAFLKRK